MGCGVIVRVPHNLQGRCACIIFHIARRLASRKIQCEVDSLRLIITYPTWGCLSYHEYSWAIPFSFSLIKE